jgi:hypothetical protein
MGAPQEFVLQQLFVRLRHIQIRNKQVLLYTAMIKHTQLY